MTNVIVNAIDVLGQEIDEGVVRISAADAQYNGGLLMLPEYHEQELVAGSTTITGVTSGKVVVTLHWDINRTATFRVFVPDTTEITLAELALQKYDSDPAVVSKVADAALRAEGAADRADDIADAFGSLEAVEGLVQSATDSASSASGSASAASSSASAAATSESNAADSEASAGTSASSAASSASAAAGSASAAAGSADSAAGSESQAASSATAAASSATVAVASAIEAEDAADRAEAGASTVGDAQTILAARDQAVTAKDGAVTAQTAAETAAANAATVAEAKAVEEVNKLKAGAPAAFDTLLEIANELGKNETERAALTNSIAGKADADHVHTSEDITDLPSWSASNDLGTLVQRSTASGNFQISPPSHPQHATTKEYVDAQVSTKANTSHTHTAVNISDATTTGRSVLTASSQAAARSAIGAGTSDLVLGTSAGSAARGNHTHSEYAEASRVTALEGSQPIIVSSLPSSPLSGRIYLVTG